MTGRAGTAKGVAIQATSIVKGRESEGGEGAGFTPIRGWWIFLLLQFKYFFSIFLNLFLTSIFNRFFFDFGGVLEAKMAPKIDFWSDLFDVFWGPSFLSLFC